MWWFNCIIEFEIYISLEFIEIEDKVMNVGFFISFRIYYVRFKLLLLCYFKWKEI